MAAGASAAFTDASQLLLNFGEEATPEVVDALEEALRARFAHPKPLLNFPEVVDALEKALREAE